MSSNTNPRPRWAVLSRWIAYVGIGAVLALGYSASRPASAQDEKGPPAPAAAKTATEKAPAGPSKADLAEAERRATEDLAKATPKGDYKGQDAAAPKATLTEELVKIIKEPGGWLHVLAPAAILLISVVSVTFAIERFIGLRRGKVVPTALMAGLRALSSQKNGLDPRQAYRLCRQYPSSAATVIKVMMQKVGRPLPEIERAVTEASEREASRLYANVRWQGLTFNVAPMLGLAGTVWGIIMAFFRTANMLPGQADRMESLASGVYVALFATLTGLVVAIPAGMLDHLFEGRILKLFREIEDLVHSMLPQLERFEGRPRGVKTVQPEAPQAAEPSRTEEAEEPKPAKWPIITPAAQ